MFGYPRGSSNYYYGEPYPRYEGNRYYRNPYEERTLSDLARAQDPYAARDRDRVRTIRSRSSEQYRQYRPSPPPLVTVTAAREDQRRSATPMQRRGPYGSFARFSETPPPRASRWGIGRFGDTFGDIPESRGRTNDRLYQGPSGPPRDPFTRHSYVGDRPYGGGPAPRNPFTPGGVLYDQPRERDRRARSLAPDLRQYENRHGREHEHYRSRMGEPWGLADYQEYQQRLRRRYS